MNFQKNTLFLCFCLLFFACTIEKPEEQIVDYHANGLKKTSIWVYPDGEISKRNEWYNNGIKEFEIPYKKNVPHGKIKRWTAMGDLVMTGNYKNGKRDGKWVSTYSDKKKEAIRYFKNDIPVGDWEGFHFNRNKAFEEHYNKEGDSIGNWKRWYANGKIAEENSCHSKTPKGEFLAYNSEGILQQKDSCAYGKKHGLSQDFFHNGKLKTKMFFAEDKLHGPRTFYYGNGKIAKEEFWNKGERAGTWRWFSPEGNFVAEASDSNGIFKAYGVEQNEIQAESTYVKTSEGYVLSGNLWYKKKGHVLRYEELWEQGAIKESRSYFPDSLGGGLASLGFWANGKREGIWRNWYRSGILQDSLTYVAGDRNGDQFFYDSTGTLYMHRTEGGKHKPVIIHLNNQQKL